jgi:Zn-dependent protease
MEILVELVLTLVPMVLSLSVHEFAHAYCANRFGDPTAKLAGRLTLDPRAHIDLWGSLLLPALSVLSHFPIIGWARPVPVRADRFRPEVSRRIGLAVVSAAGPVSNLVLAVSAGLLAILRRVTDSAASGHSLSWALDVLLSATFRLNVVLAVFNLLPIAPLDGHRLVPPALDRFLAPVQRYGFAVLMISFMVVPSIGQAVVGRPIAWVTRAVAGLFGL